MKKIVLIIVCIGLVTTGIYFYQSSQNASALKEKNEIKSLELSKETSRPREGEFQAVITEGRRKSYIEKKNNIEKELSKLGDSFDVAQYEAVREYTRYCNEVDSFEERVSFLNQERDAKLIELSGKENSEKEIAKILFDHAYQMDFLAIVKSRCLKQNG